MMEIRCMTTQCGWREAFERKGIGEDDPPKKGGVFIGIQRWMLRGLEIREAVGEVNISHGRRPCGGEARHRGTGQGPVAHKPYRFEWDHHGSMKNVFHIDYG